MCFCSSCSQAPLFISEKAETQRETNTFQKITWPMSGRASFQTGCYGPPFLNPYIKALIPSVNVIHWGFHFYAHSFSLHQTAFPDDAKMSSNMTTFKSIKKSLSSAFEFCREKDTSHPWTFFLQVIFLIYCWIMK